MKKYICIFIAALMILGICSCGDTPQARELMLTALENTKDNDYTITAGTSLIQSGVEMDTTITIDGTKDTDGNHHASYELAMTNVTYNGEFYYFDDDMLIYFQLMDVWMELYLADYFSGMTQDDLRNMFTLDIKTMLDDDSLLSYSEVKKSGGNYIFDIYIEDNAHTRQLLAAEAGSMEASGLSPEQYIDIVCKMKFTVTTDRKFGVLTGVSADFTEAFASMKDIFGTEFNSLAFDIQFSNHGNTEPVKLDESVLEECVGMIELMYYLTYSQEGL